jgi:D-hexose-6-phosphate mutarotase
MSFVVKDSTALLKRNKLNNQEEEIKDQEVNKQVILENILRIIEVDRILLNNLNAIIVNEINSHLEGQKQGDKTAPGNLDFIKECLKFTTLCFFKRAFLVM